MARQRREDSDIVVVGAASHPLRDAYHLLMTLPWWGVVATIAIGFLVINAAFALAYLVVGGVEGAQPGSFADAFFFSAQTLGTIGYGAMHPVSTTANVFVVFESITSVIITALATGIIFARFSRSQEAILFSNNPCISPMDGIPTLTLRVGNDRDGAIFDAQVRVSVVRTHVTEEKVTMYRMTDLHLSRERTPLLARTWTVLHVIDDTSPLAGLTPDICTRDDVEIVVSVVGTDDTTLQPVHGRKRYVAKEVLWGSRPADILRELPDGKLELDVRRFHDTVETEPTERFPYPKRERTTRT